MWGYLAKIDPNVLIGILSAVLAWVLPKRHKEKLAATMTQIEEFSRAAVDIVLTGIRTGVVPKETDLVAKWLKWFQELVANANLKLTPEMQNAARSTAIRHLSAGLGEINSEAMRAHAARATGDLARVPIPNGKVGKRSTIQPPMKPPPDPIKS